MNEERKPLEYDAVLGGDNPPPIQGIVLGGIEGVKTRLASDNIKYQISALSEAFNYGDEGLNLVIQALQHQSRQIQLFAYRLLRHREEKKVKDALANYQPWNLRERFQKYPGYIGRHAEIFANRRVENFNINTGIIDPVNIAYAFRVGYWEEEPSLETQINRLLQDCLIDKLEALVFGMYSDVFERGQSESVISFLFKNKNKLKNLRAIFIGDIHYEEQEISWIHQSDITPVLEAYPNLEILQVRVGEGGAFFSSTQPCNLQALIIESSGISQSNLKSICNLPLPMLEHLELWLGTSDYGGDSSIEDLSPILSGKLHPNLIYLGLRNSEYTNEIATALVDAPILNTISVLDISMGTLTDEGAEILLHGPAIRQLKLLNISENYLSDTVVKKFKKLRIEIIADNQKVEEEEDYRYCSVTE